MVRRNHVEFAPAVSEPCLRRPDGRRRGVPQALDRIRRASARRAAGVRHRAGRGAAGLACHLRRSREAGAGRAQPPPSASWPPATGASRWRRSTSAAPGRASSRRRPPSRRRRAGIRCCRASRPAPRAIASSARQPMPDPLPASDEDIAFAPLSRLSRWIETRKLTSERLTQHLSRPPASASIPSCAASSRSRATWRSRRRSRPTARSPPDSIAARCTASRGAAKDLLDTAGIPTTYGAEPYRNRVPAAGCRGREAPPRCRRRAGRQAEPGRAGAQRHLVRRPDHESVAAGGGRVRIERRPGRRDRRGTGRLLHRQRDRGQHRQPLHALRRHRAASDLRPRAAHRRHDAVLVARQARTDDPRRRGRAARAAGHLRSRPRRCRERAEPPRLRRRRPGRTDCASATSRPG